MHSRLHRARLASLRSRKPAGRARQPSLGEPDFESLRVAPADNGGRWLRINTFQVRIDTFQPLTNPSPCIPGADRPRETALSDRGPEASTFVVRAEPAWPRTGGHWAGREKCPSDTSRNVSRSCCAPVEVESGRTSSLQRPGQGREPAKRPPRTGQAAARAGGRRPACASVAPRALRVLL